MWEYLKYYFAPLVQVLAILGFYLGGHYTWIAIASFPVVALFDILLPMDLSTRRMKSHFWAYVPVWISTLLLPVMYLVFAWSVAHNELDYGQMLAGMLGLAWLSVAPGVPATHELSHSRGRLARFVGRYCQVVILDIMRIEVHMAGHHIDMATAADADTAERNVNVYRFVWRSVIHTLRSEIKLQSDTLQRRGFSRSSIRHLVWRALLAVVLLLSAVHALGGWTAVALCALSMVIARFLIEAFNYYQHFGLVRVAGTPADKRHVWSHYGRLMRLYTFEITNHADHHMNSYTPYYRLVPDSAGILMPSVMTCFLSGFIPPLWYRAIIKPALKRWDNERASPAERHLAREQNRRAGWEDWFGGQGDQPLPAGDASVPQAPARPHPQR